LKKVTIEGVEYSLTVIPPYLLPFLNLYGELATKSAKTIEEAEQVSREMRRASEKILEACVSPKPKPEHETELFRYISNLTSRTIQEVDSFFQGGKAPADIKSGGRIKLLDRRETLNPSGSE
jgi:hypothetical protein